MNANFRKEQSKEKFEIRISRLWGLSKLNYFIFAVGLISIFLGYIIMATGKVDSFQSLTIAPTFLFLGYIILIPVSLLIKKKKN